MSNRIEPVESKPLDSTQDDQSTDLLDADRFKDISYFIYQQNADLYKEYFSKNENQSFHIDLNDKFKQKIESKICTIS